MNVKNVIIVGTVVFASVGGFIASKIIKQNELDDKLFSKREEINEFINTSDLIKRVGYIRNDDYSIINSLLNRLDEARTLEDMNSVFNDILMLDNVITAEEIAQHVKNNNMEG